MYFREANATLITIFFTDDRCSPSDDWCSPSTSLFCQSKKLRDRGMNVWIGECFDSFS